MHQCDSGGDGRINFEEFYKNMMPLWAFGSKVGEEERWGEKRREMERRGEKRRAMERRGEKRRGEEKT